jgi:hypothetical protein
MVAQRSALFHRTICPSRWELLVVFTISIAEQKKKKSQLVLEYLPRTPPLRGGLLFLQRRRRKVILTTGNISSTSQKIAYKKSKHGTTNKLKCIILNQRVSVTYNVTHLLAWSVNIVTNIK